MLMPYANNKGADQPAHPCSLISTFVARCQDSIIPLVSIPKISSLYLASVAAWAGLSLLWSQTSKTGFSCVSYKKAQPTHVGIDSVGSLKKVSDEEENWQQLLIGTVNEYFPFVCFCRKKMTMVL